MKTNLTREEFIGLYHSMSESISIVSFSTLLALIAAGFAIFLPIPGTIIASITISSISILAFLFGAIGYLATEIKYKRTLGIPPFRILPYKIRWVKVK